MQVGAKATCVGQQCRALRRGRVAALISGMTE
jgi:hypothetical protein